MATSKAAPKTSTVTEFPALPKIEVPEAVRAVAEKSVTQAKAAYETMKTSAEEATDMLEEGFAKASKGYTELGQKAIEAARANTNAMFDFAAAMMGVKSVSEAIELQSAHARQQFDLVSAQSRDMAETVGSIAGDVSRPYQAVAARGFAFGK